MVEHLNVAQAVAGSNPVIHPFLNSLTENLKKERVEEKISVLGRLSIFKKVLINHGLVCLYP